MQWKTSVATGIGVSLALVSQAAGHSVFLDAVGDANPQVHGCGIGVDMLVPDLTKYIARNWRDVIVFSIPWQPNRLCTECPRAATIECADCLCKPADNCPAGQRFITGCTKCSKYNLNCAKCRTPIPNTCGRRLKPNMTNFFTEDYSGTASLPHPSNPKAVELIDPQRKLNTKVWTEAFVQQNRIPLVSPGGLLTVSVRQVNADGAGPYTCRISYAGTEDKWDDKPLKIITNVPGVAGISTAVSTTFPLIVKLPDDLECDGSYGGKKNICMVQCVNGAPNGPFGGCVPIEVKPSAKPPPAPKPYTPPPPPPAKDKAEVKSYADGEDLTKEQLGALTGYYKKKLRLRKLRFFRD